MQQQALYSRLQEVFDSVFMEPVTVTPELSAKDVEEWDSLANVSLIAAVESAFKVRFRVGEVEKTKNVGDLVTIIEKRLPVAPR